MATKKPDPEQTPPPPDNVDQIREILFGNQIRAVDERFQTVEKRMSKESENLRKTLEKRILELENLLDQFRDNAGDQLNRESYFSSRMASFYALDAWKISWENGNLDAYFLPTVWTLFLREISVWQDGKRIEQKA